MKIISILILFFFIISPAISKTVGSVVSLKGTVFKKNNKSSSYRKLIINEAISQGDEIRTSLSGKVKIIFDDNSIIQIAPRSKMIITKFIYNPNKGRETTINLVAGKLRSWTASLMAKKKNFTVKTPTSVIGVRGTEFIINVESDEKTEIAVLSGKVSVKSRLGMDQAEYILKKNMFTSVIGTTALPGTELTTEQMKRLNKDLDLPVKFKFKVNFKALRKKMDIKSFNSQKLKNSFLSKTNKLKIGKISKKIEPDRYKKMVESVFDRNFLSRPRVNINFKAKVVGE